MRALLQRVCGASVAINDRVVGEIGPGLVVFLGVGRGDSEQTARALAEKVAHLRIFADEASKFNRSLLDTHGGALVVSQFTLYADCRRGRRPGFSEAAEPGEARALVEHFARHLEGLGVHVECGEFGAHMLVHIENDGPVTIYLDSQEVVR